MKPNYFLPVLICLSIILSACGGGGGPGNGGNTIGTVSNIAPVTTFAGTQSPANRLDLAPGDQVQIQLVGTDSTTNLPTTVTASGYSTNAPSSVLTVDSNGLITVVGPGTGTYNVTATASGHTFSFPVTVVAGEARVAGLVRTPDLTGQLNVTVDFYNSAGVVVTSTTTGSDGTFIANVPTTATSFSLKGLNSLGFYNQFDYGTLSYAAGILTCNPALPALSPSTTVVLAHQLVVTVVNQQDPPPPPTGCH